MSEVFDEAALLVDEAVKRLEPARRTFTEREAMGPVWEAGYEVPIQADARFVLAREGDRKNPRHWYLASQTVANNRLLNDLLSGAWDGHDLDGKLATLDAEAEYRQHHVFCSSDPRLAFNAQGMLEPTERERRVPLSKTMKATLDALGPDLLAHWRSVGAEPWTVRVITEMLYHLGWQDGAKQNAWLYVRSWLLSWPQVVRVGQDYWIPADEVPQAIQQTRLQVLPIRASEVEATLQASEAPQDGETRLISVPPPTAKRAADESQVALGGEATTPSATWSVRLRTANLFKGFLHVPAVARNAYPPPVPGEEQKIVLRGMWYEDITRFWLWLDRTKNQLYGPGLADRLSWLETGDLLRIDWTPDIIVMRLAGHDAEVQNEEARLIDSEELAALRGGLGESYRRSLQAILVDTPQGLTFAEVVGALRARQGHDVHRGTIRALLYSGGFLQKGRRWLVAPDNEVGARQLRAALVETLVPEEQREEAQPFSHAEYVRRRVKAIHARLAEIIAMLAE